MELPVKVVRYLSSGALVRINASDFDPALHEEYVEAPPEPEPPEPPAGGDPNGSQDEDGDGVDTTPGDITGVNAAAALALIAEAGPDALDMLEEAEHASKKCAGGRKGVLKAIAARRAELVRAAELQG